MKPFMDKEERDKILKERDKLVEQINNLDSCNNFGGCQYRGLCEKGSMKGLEVVK